MKRLLTVASVLLIVGGVFLASNSVAPALPQKIEPKVEAKAPDTIQIPRIGIEAPIVAGDSDALNKGAWHRFPERGNPVAGGNMILSAHSFIFRWNPVQTRQDSYFYNLHKAVKGDDVRVYWHGKLYHYIVAKVYQVKPDDLDIEKTDGVDRLTIYTCTPGGSSDGRVVVEARPN